MWSKSLLNATQAVEYFKDGSQPVLVATDVCARGLDIPDVEVVINYSFPLTVEVRGLISLAALLVSVADAVRRLSYAEYCLRAVRLTSQDYVHRIGRTGRGGKTGLSHTLFTIADKTLAGPLSDVLKGMCCVCSVIYTHPCAFHMQLRARSRRCEMAWH
jgi:ATP-dependent RNA helicase DBP3